VGPRRAEEGVVEPAPGRREVALHAAAGDEAAGAAEPVGRDAGAEGAGVAGDELAAELLADAEEVAGDLGAAPLDGVAGRGGRRLGGSRERQGEERGDHTRTVGRLPGRGNAVT
jgi:hypothetical protein